MAFSQNHRTGIHIRCENFPDTSAIPKYHRRNRVSRRKTSMEQELKNLKGEKMRMYEEYAAGTLSLDNYKNKKQEYDRKIAEVQDKIEQSKAEEAAQSVVPGTVRAAAEQAENFLHGTRLTASICDFYDSAGGWQRGCVFGTGGSNDSASMVHIRKGET